MGAWLVFQIYVLPISKIDIDIANWKSVPCEVRFRTASFPTAQQSSSLIVNMKHLPSNEVSLSMGHRSSFPPTNIHSSPLDRQFAIQVHPEGSLLHGAALGKMVDQASLGSVSTNLQVSSEGNQSTNGSFSTIVVLPSTTQHALVSPALLGSQQIHARGAPRRRQTPRYSHVPPVQLELLLDNAASFIEMLQDMEQVRRPSSSPPYDDPVVLGGVVDERNHINQGLDEVIDDGSASVASSFESDWIDETI